MVSFKCKSDIILSFGLCKLVASQVQFSDATQPDKSAKDRREASDKILPVIFCEEDADDDGINRGQLLAREI
jgi:hypothetical protein